jgi:DeoR/GlpR family transcriptional regulator of sugar metabolism
LSEQALEELHTQKAYISCSGFSLERGLMEVHLAEAHLKRKALTSFATIDQINHLLPTMV